MNDVFLLEQWDRLRTTVPPFLARCGAALCGGLIETRLLDPGRPDDLGGNGDA
jgi:hypothetical protein